MCVPGITNSFFRQRPISSGKNSPQGQYIQFRGKRLELKTAAPKGGPMHPEKRTDLIMRALNRYRLVFGEVRGKCIALSTAKRVLPKRNSSSRMFM